MIGAYGASMSDILDEAIDKAEGLSKLARACGVTKSAVWQWRRKNGSVRIPPRHCLNIEALTGISRHKLRPDVFGSEEKPIPHPKHRVPRLQPAA
jgi:transcriptional regulator with XRE-family HTH domain